MTMLYGEARAEAGTAEGATALVRLGERYAVKLLTSRGGWNCELYEGDGDLQGALPVAVAHSAHGPLAAAVEALRLVTCEGGSSAGTL